MRNDPEGMSSSVAARAPQTTIEAVMKSFCVILSERSTRSPTAGPTKMPSRLITDMAVPMVPVSKPLCDR